MMGNLEKCYGLNQLKCYKMGRTLWVYGCSWTKWESLITECKDFKFWPDIIGENLKLNVINRACGGTSINYSFRKLIEDLPLIKSNDIVIFEFTYSNRFSLDYLVVNNPREKWDSNLAKDYGNGIVAKFDRHTIDYFRAEKFYSDDKIQSYLDFILNFDEELLLNDFFTINTIFNHIENVIGAKVKYWFLKIYGNINNHKLEKLTDTVWDNEKIISFPQNSRYVEATGYIKNAKQRFCDNNDTKLKWLDHDHHPTQNGHQMLAKEIMKSINNEK